MSVDLTKESVQYSTGDVLVVYAVILVVTLSIAFIAFKLSSRKHPGKKH